MILHLVSDAPGDSGRSASSVHFVVACTLPYPWMYAVVLPEQGGVTTDPGTKPS